MRRLATWAPLAGILACASGAKPDDGVGGNVDAGAPPPAASASRFLYFTLGPDAWIASAAGTDGTRICEGAVPSASLEGSRALCVPTATDQPLVLFDVNRLNADLGRVTTYEGWQASAFGRPALNADGTMVAFSALDENHLPVVRVLDDRNSPLGELEAFDVLGWAGNRGILVNAGINSPALWVITEDAARPFAGTNAVGVGPDPAGAVYETQAFPPQVAFLDVSGQVRELGEGKLGGAVGSRVLIRPLDGQAGDARLVDLKDGDFEGGVAVPAPPFDRPSIGVRLITRSALLIEQQLYASCAGTTKARATKTTWHEVEEEREVVLADTGADPHAVYVDRVGEHALVLHVDPCGNPNGEGSIVNLESGEARALTEYLPDAVLRGGISPDGRFVGLGLEGGLQVLDLSDGTLRVAATGADGGQVMEFR